MLEGKVAIVTGGSRGKMCIRDSPEAGQDVCRRPRDGGLGYPLDGGISRRGVVLRYETYEDADGHPGEDGPKEGYVTENGFGHEVGTGYHEGPCDEGPYPEGQLGCLLYTSRCV